MSSFFSSFPEIPYNHQPLPSSRWQSVPLSYYSDSTDLMLGKCITDYIDNEKIKTLAKASAWLGNDETHYVRKHQNYNVQDLKRFIKATVAYIEYELSFTEAFDLLKNPQ